MKKYFTFSILLLLIIFQTSCTLHIEKRRYNKGYYVELGQKQKTKTSPTINISSSKVYTKKNEVVSIDKKIIIDPVKTIPIVSGYKKETLVNTKRSASRKKVIPDIKTEKCDKIRLLDGTEIEALIETISDNEISYKKCSFLDGPTFKLSIFKVKEIEFKNGEIYKPQATGGSKGENYPEVSGGMVVGIVLGILAFIALIVGIVLVMTSYGFLGGLIAAIPLAIAGILSLIGIIISARFLQKGAHPLGKAAFYINLIVQILAIIFTVLMFVI